MPRTKKTDSTDSVAQRSSIFGTGKAKGLHIKAKHITIIKLYNDVLLST